MSFNLGDVVVTCAHTYNGVLRVGRITEVIPEQTYYKYDENHYWMPTTEPKYKVTYDVPTWSYYKKQASVRKINIFRFANELLKLND